MGDRFPKGIQINDHHVDLGYFVAVEFLCISAISSPGEDPPKDLWMKRFDPSAKDARIAGELFHRMHRKSECFDVGISPTCGIKRYSL